MQANSKCKATWSTPHAGRGRYIQSRDWLRFIGVAGVMLLISAAPTVVFAGAFRVFDQSASGTAQGGAFAAQADDPSAVYFNPAGITQLSGIQTSAGPCCLAAAQASPVRPERLRAEILEAASPSRPRAIFMSQRTSKILGWPRWKISLQESAWFRHSESCTGIPMTDRSPLR